MLVCCDECPASYHFDCLGMTEEVRTLLKRIDSVEDLCLPHATVVHLSAVVRVQRLCVVDF